LSFRIKASKEALLNFTYGSYDREIPVCLAGSIPSKAKIKKRQGYQNKAENGRKKRGCYQCGKHKEIKKSFIKATAAHKALLPLPWDNPFCSNVKIII
jgi:hypothetical protein